jgi:glutaconate CoA-transferase subunit A
MVAWDRFRADREGMEFWPVDFLGGSDILTYNDKIVPFKSPVSDKQLYAIPAAKVDFALIHAYAGDRYGNIQHQEKVMIPQTIDFDIARGCDNTIVTVEKLLSDEEVAAGNHRTVLPAFKTLAVSHIPFGSHPTPTQSVSRTAEAFFEAYAQASETEETFAKYLERYVYGCSSFAEYLELVKADFSEKLEVK